MTRSILYYPTIDIKDGDWLRSAVLYWDKIGSIVPTGCEDMLSAELRYLKEQNIYQPVMTRKKYVKSLLRKVYIVYPDYWLILFLNVLMSKKIPICI